MPPSPPIRRVNPRRVARMQTRFLRGMGATPQEIRRWRPLLTAQIGAESNFTQGVGSPAGARDIAQFMPGTAPSYGVRLGDGRIKDDIRGQVRYMLPLLRKYGAEGALRGYNAGPGNIQASEGFSETNNYVRRVLGTRGQYRFPNMPGAPAGAEQPGGAGVAPGLSIQLPPGQDLSGLLAAITGRKPVAPSSGMLAAPGFSARNALALPGMYQQLDTGQAPGPKPDELKDLLGQLATPFALASVTGTPGAQGGRGGYNAPEVKPGKAVLGPNADRAGVPTSKRILQFVGQVAGIVGKDSLTIGTGSRHSQYTSSGNVSNHWTGHGADVPSAGAELTRLGRAALIAAGMSPKQARKAKGGIFNLNGWQIIFNEDDHWDHLHVGWRGR